MDGVVKRCSKCGEVKSVELFSFRKRAQKELQSSCKVCMTEAWKRWYANPDNRARHIKHNGRTSKLLLERNRGFIIDHLEANPCVDCGNPDIRVLEFDHVRGDKVSTVSELWSGGLSIARIQSEIDKCEVVCANCHRIRTGARADWFRHRHVQSMGDEGLEPPKPSGCKPDALTN